MHYYQERIAKLAAWMEETHVDLTIVTSPGNVMYLSGFYGNPHERFMGVMVPRTGEPFLLVPGLDRDKAAAKGALPVYGHSDTDQPIDVLRQALELKAEDIHKIAIEKSHLTVSWLEQLEANFPAAMYANAEDRLLTMRLQKDPHEMALMRRAAKLADEAVQFAAAQISLGLKEYEIVQAVESFARQQGAERMAFDTMVLAGENSALPHGVPGMREIRRGDLVLFDLGIVWEGYCSDITRTVAVGEASDAQRQIYEAVRAANQAAIEMVRPGATAAEIDRAARKVITDAGYGDFFTHRVGHGLGIDVHEAPSMHGQNGQILLPGMTFTIEPGIYLPGVGGVRIEDDVLVTDSGVEVLTRYPKELQIVDLA